ncbi:MAG TPA: sigma-70 family RNA polymerase sigma factor [Silvibacterium sp.]|nr:sigma-70 family RNA polymerase sigma factor [Silvibacterium sp.]
MAASLQFEEVIEEHKEFVFRTLARLTGASEVEDLAQEVFLRLYRGIESFRGESKLTTWLYRITLNVAQDEWKRRKKEQANTSFDDPDAGWAERISGSESNAEQILSRRESMNAVNAALTELSEPERAAIVMFHQEDCTYEQIALTLKLPLNTVRTHLHRGRQKLKESLKEHLSERRTACGIQVVTR